MNAANLWTSRLYGYARMAAPATDTATATPAAARAAVGEAAAAVSTLPSLATFEAASKIAVVLGGSGDGGGGGVVDGVRDPRQVRARKSQAT